MMRILRSRYCFFLLLSTISVKAIAQDIYLNVMGGFANYQGDIQSKRFTINQAGAAFGAQLIYELSPRIALRGGITYGKIQGSDAKSGNSAQIKRNLSFESNIFEGHAGMELHLLDIYEKRFSPYVFAGVALYKYNPFTFSPTGRKVYLQPLSTEGQGLLAYPDRKPYKLTQISLPFGGGFRLAVSDNVRLGFEVGLRKTLTDYLDDVSDKYADQVKLLDERGQESVDLAYRGDELPGGLPYPTESDLRGNPKSKDWYYFAGFTIGIRLLGEGETYSPNANMKRYRMGCPKNVY
jgi:opacity protein-like surface antigen